MGPRRRGRPSSRTRELNEGLAAYGLQGKVRRFHHHDTHAANAFFVSGFDKALLVTLDGYGSGCCGGVYTGDANGIRMLHRFDFPNSLGIFYEHVTSGLGFRAGRHEGKIVGPGRLWRSVPSAPVYWIGSICDSGDIQIRGSLNYYFARALADRFAKRDVAAAYQQVLEDCHPAYGRILAQARRV